MKVNENKLRDALREAIADINNRPSHVEKTLKEMALHMFNFTGGEMAYILNGRTPVDGMTEDTMYKITSVLYEYMKNNPSNYDIERLNVDKYFNKDEIRIYKKKINRKVIDKEIVFKNYLKVSDDQYLITLTNKEITELVSNGRIHYNPETQRELTEIQTEFGVVKKVTIVTSALNSIIDNMSLDRHIPDAITWNINPDLYPVPQIKKEGLVLSEETFIDCTDGYHRTKSMVIVTRNNPDWERTFYIVLTLFDVTKAKEYIIQENYKNPLSEERETELDQYDGANFIINKLKDSMYFKSSNIKEISYSLNKLITQIYNPERITNTELIQKAVNLFKNIEKNMNDLIENNNLFGKNFTKEEWFIYLYLINYCINNNKNFINVVKNIDINALLEQISITKEAGKGHFKLMNEVIKNV